MQYELYERKIEKVASALKFILKHLIIISVVAAVIAGAVCALLATKGRITDIEACQSAIIYGESVDIGGKAFMSDVTYEYSPLGKNEWTDKLPSKPGQYEIRAVAYGSFGTKKYSDPAVFELKPKSIDLSVDTKLAWGEHAGASAVGLINGDTLIDSEFSIESISGNTVELTLVEGSVVIHDADGNDVTSSYVIGNKSGTATIVNRTLSIKVNDKSKVYDGEALVSDEYIITAGSIASGEKAEINFDGIITNVGEVTNNASVKILGNGGIDVSEHYNITVVPGTLTVTQRVIEISSSEESFVYDGEEHKNGNISVTAGEIVEGQNLSCVSSLGVVNAGEYENTFTYAITDSEGNDVSDNYFVTAVYGKLNVTKRPVKITTGSGEWVYDGYEHINTECAAIENIIDGHTVATVGNVTGITFFGEAENILTYDIYDADGQSVSSNYEIEYTYGVLKINKRLITVASADLSNVYDGLSHYTTEFSVISEIGLSDLDAITVTKYADIINVGEIQNIIEIVIKRNGEDKDVSDCYEVSFEYGTLEIVKRKVQLVPDDISKIYDGSEAITLLEDGTIALKLYMDSEYALIDGHQAFAVPVFENAINVGTHRYTADQVRIICNGVDLTENYDVSVEYAQLVINKRSIQVETFDGNKIYDNTALVNHGFGITDGSEYTLVNGHIIFLDVISEIVNVGETENLADLNSLRILDGAGVDVTENYAVEFIYGKLKVDPRPITVLTASNNWIYDGETHFLLDFSIISEIGLVNDQNAFALEDQYASVTEVLEAAIDNVFAIVIRDIDGNDLSYNYDITYEYGSLKIDKRAVTVVTSDREFVYDSYANSSADAVCDELVLDHYLVSDKITEVINAGTYLNENEYLIFDGSGNDKTHNYDIVYEYGTLTVLKRNITVATDSFAWVYDGQDQSYGIYYVISELGIADNDYSEIFGELTYIRNVGKIANVFAIDIIGADGESALENYNVEYEYGELEIVKRSVTLAPADVTKIYDGTAFFDYIVELYATSQYPLVSGHLASGDISGAGVNVGVYTTILENVRIFEGETDVTENYDIAVETGIAYIEQRPIEVYTGSSEKIYDGMPLTDANHGLTDGNIYGLVEGDILILETNGSITDVGSVSNTVDYYSVAIFDANGNDVTLNYSIEYVLGELVVTPRPVTFTTATNSWVYDGNEHDDKSFDITSELGLVAGHTAYVLTYTSIVDAGNTSNVLYISIYDEDGYDVSYNYDISYEYGTLEVMRKQITVTTGSEYWTYDSMYHSNTDHSYSDIVYGHVLVPYEAAEIINVGRIENVVSYYVYDSYGNDKTANYEITYQYGSLIITPREITVRTDSASWVYDGDEHYYNYYTIISELGIAINDYSFSAGEYTYIENVGTAENIFAIDIANSLGESVISNYIVNYEYGVLEIVKRSVTLGPVNVEKIYDGTDAFDYSIETSTGSEYDIVFGQNPVGDISGAGVNVGVYTTILENVRIFEGETDVTENYDISIENGFASILQRPIEIYTESDSKIYDAEELTNSGYGVTGSTGYGLVEDDILFIDVIGSITNVGFVFNTVDEESIRIFDKNGVDVTANYQISFSLGTLTVQRRAIMVVTGSESWVYDGIEHSNSFAEVADPDTLENQSSGISSIVYHGLVSGHYLDILYVPTIINVTKITNDISVAVLDGEGNDMSENYSIYYTYGTVEITPKPITVITNSGEWTYDGYSHSSTDAICDELVEGHYLDYYSATSVTYVGEYENVVEYDVYDAYGNYQSGNYDITYEYGTLVINHREITVFTGSEELIYNGYDQYYHDFEIISDTILADYEYAYADDEGSAFIRNVGSVENVYSIIIYNRYGTNVTDNYIITYEYGTITVVEREITVKPYDVYKTYDATAWHYSYPEISYNSANYLPGMHYIEADITIVGDGINVGEYELVLENVRIMDGDEDVTSNYIINLESGTMYVSKREIQVESATDEKVYDGTPLTNGSFWLNEDEYCYNDYYDYYYYYYYYLLVEGHTLYVDVIGTITKAGSVENIIDAESLVILDAEGVDVTENYLVNYKNGTLTVTQRVIEIKTEGGEWLYDGYDHYDENVYIVSGSLAENDEIADRSPTLIRNVGRVENYIEFIMINADGEDVSDCYDVLYSEVGILEVTQREITVTTDSYSWVYDGYEHTCEDYTIGGAHGLADRQSDKIWEAASIIYTGTKDNVITICILDEEGNDVTSNYEISYTYGTLEITKRAITILTGSNSWVYDGSYKMDKTYTVLSETKLADTDTLAPTNASITKIVNVGSCENIYVAFVKHENGDIVTDNYEITYEYGTLDVTKRDVILKPSDVSKVYDGTNEVSVKIVESSNSANKIVFGQKAYADIVGGGILVGDYTLQLENVRIMKGSVDVSENYNIILEDGKLTITQRSIKITTESDSKIYDGTALENKNFEYNSGTNKGLVAGETLTINVIGSITRVGRVENGVDQSSLLILDKDGNDVTHCYSAEYVLGTLRIDPREIVVVTDSETWIYDATEHSNSSATIVSGELVAGHEIFSASYTSITNVGKAANRISLNIRDEFGDDVTDCYSIVYQSLGTLEVTPRRISVTTMGGSWVYDALAHSLSEYIITGGDGLVSDHMLKISGKVPSITNVGKINNSIVLRVMDSELCDVSANYSIEYTYGELEVTARRITVITDSKTSVYDGEAKVGGGFIISPETPLADGDKAQVSTYTGNILIDVGSFVNEFEIDVYNSSKAKVTGNYEISYIYGTVTVLPREITIRVNGYKEYDGKPITEFDAYVDEDLSKYKLANGHRISARANEILTEIGSCVSTVDLSSISITDASGRDVTHNYIVNTEYGVLTVNKRQITVSSASESKIYDGLPLTNGSYTIENLFESGIEDLYVEVVIYGSITEIGKVENQIGDIRIFSAGNDITEYFDINRENGILEILPIASILVITHGADKYYDARPLINENYDVIMITGNLREGDRIIVEVNGFIIEVGEVSNAAVVKVVDAYGTDVSSYYTIQLSLGKLIIKKPPTNVDTDEDGMPDINIDKDENGLPDINIDKDGDGKADTNIDKDGDGTPDINEDTDNDGYADTNLDTDGDGKPDMNVDNNGDGKPDINVDNDGDGKADTDIDTDGDGNPDINKDTDGDGKADTNLDIDGDGKPDINKDTDGDGEPDTNLDTDGDGTPDENVDEIPDINKDTDGDGKPDINVDNNEDGKADINIDTDGDGKPDINVDNDGDGDADTNIDKNGDGKPDINVDNDGDGKPDINLDNNNDGLADTDIDTDGDGVADKDLSGGGSGSGSGGSGSGSGGEGSGSGGSGSGSGGEGSGSGGSGSGSGGEGSGSGSGGSGSGSGGSGSGGSGGGKLDTSGGIGGLGDYVTDSEGGSDTEDTICYVIYTEKSGRVYLKVMSFGDYDGRSFEDAPEYQYLIDDQYSAAYLTAMIIEACGGTENVMKILSYYGQLVIPYYAYPTGDNIQLSDSVFTGDIGREELYEITYFDLGDVEDLELMAALVAYEQAYRSFVYKNYLSMDMETRRFMEAIIEEQGFDINSPTIINEIAQYIANAASYSLKYNKALDKEDNIVISFLRDYKSGVCSHYAAAATMLFRAMGIPARYTVGFTTYAEGGEYSNVTAGEAHAWVEVYINGIGWVAVEVTGSSADSDFGGIGGTGGIGGIGGSGSGSGGSGSGGSGSGGSGSGGSGSGGSGSGGSGSGGSGSGSGDTEEEPIKLTITPIYVCKEYDGLPLYADNKVIETYDLSQLLKLGYSYEVVVSGSLTSVGSVETIIESFVLYNESGIDVTSDFDIAHENGKLDVFGRVIKIFLYKLQKYYDGEALSYADDDWELITELGANEELILDIMISLTNVGRLTLSDINMNIDDYIKYKYYKDGVDCSANVSIVVDIFDDMDISGEYVPIEVNKLDIEITTGSASKVYDGKPLRDGEVYISKGSLNFGDKLQAYTSGVITEIGEVDNTIESYKIINQNGEDVTDNYNIIIKEGTLTVTPPGVTL